MREVSGPGRLVCFSRATHVGGEKIETYPNRCNYPLMTYLSDSEKITTYSFGIRRKLKYEPNIYLNFRTLKTITYLIVND